MSQDCRQCVHAGDPELPVTTTGRNNVVGCLWRPTASARVPFWCRPGLIRVGRERARECDCYEEEADAQP